MYAIRSYYDEKRRNLSVSPFFVVPRPLSAAASALFSAGGHGSGWQSRARQSDQRPRSRRARAVSRQIASRQASPPLRRWAGGPGHPSTLRPPPHLQPTRGAPAQPLPGSSRLRSRITSYNVCYTKLLRPARLRRRGGDRSGGHGRPQPGAAGEGLSRCSAGRRSTVPAVALLSGQRVG